MTITNGYCTVGDLQETIGSTLDTPNMERAINTASRRVDTYCGRRFYIDDTLDSRLYRAVAPDRVIIDDITDNTSMTVKTNPSNSGTYQTTIASTDYVLRPEERGLNGAADMAWTEILLVNGEEFTSGNGRPEVEITALYGWETVPADVVQATILLASYVFRSKDAPFGAVGVSDLGITRARMPAIVAELLDPYRRYGAVGTPMVG